MASFSCFVDVISVFLFWGFWGLVIVFFFFPKFSFLWLFFTSCLFVSFGLWPSYHRPFLHSILLLAVCLCLRHQYKSLISSEGVEGPCWVAAFSPRSPGWVFLLEESQLSLFAGLFFVLFLFCFVSLCRVSFPGLSERGKKEAAVHFMFSCIDSKITSIGPISSGSLSPAGPGGEPSSWLASQPFHRLLEDLGLVSCLPVSTICLI